MAQVVMMIILDRIDAAMEKDRQLAIEKEKQKEEAKRRFVHGLSEYTRHCGKMLFYHVITSI